MLQDFEETFYDLITFTNKKYASILAEYQLITSIKYYNKAYYIDYDLKEGDVYSETERATFLPVVVQKFVRSELTGDD